MSKGQRKGSSFERETIKELSLWWSGGKRDDIYRRSAISGGRATVRAKSGKGTFGQYGDVAIADPIGQPLLDICSIEMKTGYPGQSMLDLIDRKPGAKPTYGEFIKQVYEEQRLAKTPFWLLIARRKGKIKMVYLPMKLINAIVEEELLNPLLDVPKAVFRINIPAKKTTTHSIITGIALTDFFNCVKPETFVAIAKHHKGGKHGNT